MNVPSAGLKQKARLLLRMIDDFMVDSFAEGFLDNDTHFESNFNVGERKYKVKVERIIDGDEQTS